MGTSTPGPRELPSPELHKRPSAFPTENDASAYPILESPLFQFRQFALADIAPLVSLANEHRIADTTIGLPYPYTNEFARQWIASHADAWQARRALHWAVVKIGDDRIVGYAGLHSMDRERRQAELRFWVGHGVERQRHGVEWSVRIVNFAFTTLALDRVYALQLARHPLGGRVLSRVGMTPEGVVRKRIFKDGLMEDVICWATYGSTWERHPRG